MQCELESDLERAAQQGASTEQGPVGDGAEQHALPGGAAALQENTPGPDQGQAGDEQAFSGRLNEATQLKRPGDPPPKPRKNQKAQKLMSGFFTPSG